MPSRRLILAAAFLLAFAPVASAQLQTTAERATLLRDAFASPYGKALTAELGKSLRKDADPVCLKEKGLEAGQLEGRGRDLLIKWGTKFSEDIAGLSDMKVYAQLFTASAEFDRLKQNADVKRYLAISAPARHAKVLETTLEDFERYVLINRIKLTPVHPLATGNVELEAKNPTVATEEALEKFVASRKSAALERYLNLSDQAAAAMVASIDKDKAKRTPPHAFFKGVEADLAELCITRRSQS
jgi:hypothetical protein